LYENEIELNFCVSDYMPYSLLLSNNQFNGHCTTLPSYGKSILDEKTITQSRPTADEAPF